MLPWAVSRISSPFSTTAVIARVVFLLPRGRHYAIKKPEFCQSSEFMAMTLKRQRQEYGTANRAEGCACVVCVWLRKKTLNQGHEEVNEMLSDTNRKFGHVSNNGRGWRTASVDSTLDRSTKRDCSGLGSSQIQRPPDWDHAISLINLVLSFLLASPFVAQVSELLPSRRGLSFYCACCPLQPFPRPASRTSTPLLENAVSAVPLLAKTQEDGSRGGSQIYGPAHRTDWRRRIASGYGGSLPGSAAISLPPHRPLPRLLFLERT